MVILLLVQLTSRCIRPQTGMLLCMINAPNDMIFNIEPTPGTNTQFLTGTNHIYKATLVDPSRICLLCFSCLLPFDSPPCFLPRIAYYLFLLPATFLCGLYQISGIYRGLVPYKIDRVLILIVRFNNSPREEPSCVGSSE